ncbi:MAG: rRNA maturation RNase YbeY [Wenzhouxiangellaceae bacterium]
MMGIEIQRQLELDGIPDDERLRRYAEAAFDDPAEAEICLRIVDEAEGRALNLLWRGKDYATNVLSFAGSRPPGLPEATVPELMGDIVLCAPVVAREGEAQDKPLAHHWAHLVVHGVLHLRGFDHIEQPSASLMEQREREILAGLGIPDPYPDSNDSAA